MVRRAFRKDGCILADPRRTTRKIKSIGAGFKLVRAAESAGQPRTLSQLAEAAQMTPSQAQLYLRSLVDVGVLHFDAKAQHYALGAGAVRLGLAAIRQNPAARAARTAMAKAAEDLDAPVFLSVWAENGPTIIEKIDFNDDLPVMIRVGHTFPLTQSVTGQVFLAFQSAEVSADVLARECRVVSIDAGVLDDLRAMTRSQGYATSPSHSAMGYSAVALPIWSAGHDLLGAMTAIGRVDHPALQDRAASAAIMQRILRHAICADLQS